MADDFYELLDVPPDADQQEIQAAFREKAREFHPDLNDDERANEQFKTLHRARDVLTDPEERAAYDRLGHEKYVTQRMGGLPTFGRAQSEEDDGGRDRTTERRNSASETRSGRSHDDGRSRDPGRSDDRYGSGAAFRGQRQRQRTARRRRRLVTEAGALVATLTYLVGVATFLQAGGGPGIADADPMTFSTDALAAPSVALAFPLGAALFPLGVGAAALVANRGRGAVVALAALGPLAGLASGSESAPVLFAAFLLAPAGALAGFGALAAARRR
ncbi:MAG: DnaJ domain-containing protein [Halobacteriaceae archaeon]